MTRFSPLSNAALLTETRRLVARERQATAALVEALTEIDARKLYLPEGFSSLFDYCTRSLGLSEPASYKRIEIARAARVFPALLPALDGGELTLSAAVVIAAHLTPDNCTDLISAASFKSKREVERVIAERFPQPDVPDVVRKQPVRGGRGASPAEVAAPSALLDVAGALLDAAGAPAENVDLPTDSPQLVVTPAPAQHVAAVAGSTRHGEAPSPIPTSPPAPRVPPPAPAIVAPLSAARYKVQFTADQETHDKLRHAQALLRHQIPSGDIAAIVKKALTLLIADVEKKKAGVGAKPRVRKEQPAVASGGPSAEPGTSSSTGDASRQPAAAASRELASARSREPGSARSRQPAAAGSREPASARSRQPAAAGSTRRTAGGSASRHVPVDVRRAVWNRDGARCAFTGPDGRCLARGRLEYHHVVPYAAGGLATVDNIQLRCRAHNAHEAVVYFGEEVAAQRT